MMSLATALLGFVDARGGVAAGAAVAAVALAMVLLARQRGGRRRAHRVPPAGRSRPAVAAFRPPHTATTPQWLRWAATVSRAFVLVTSIGAAVILVVLVLLALV